MTRVFKMMTAGMAGAALVLLLTAATRPASLSNVMGGLYEIDTIGKGDRPRLCVADPMLFTNYEHRGRACTRTVISDGPKGAIVEYNCPGRGFGRSTVKALTPKSLRVDTQGISGGAPFQYVFQARRVGDCQ